MTESELVCSEMENLKREVLQGKESINSCGLEIVHRHVNLIKFVQKGSRDRYSEEIVYSHTLGNTTISNSTASWVRCNGVSLPTYQTLSSFLPIVCKTPAEVTISQGA